MRKTMLSIAAGVGIAATSLLTTGTASAATWAFAGVYPSVHACSVAGNAGFPQGRWVGFRCDKRVDNGYVQYELWTQTTY
ncbi:hypothetical protein [Amycolatopsis minnesotensis]|uniref:Secreted protein n=1 Tax=Amycolatopsis minnesotensis TaxID=337894 RepID=A0ABN2Q1G8_9PSEU